VGKSSSGLVDGKVNKWYIKRVIIAKLENNIFEYEGETNYVILPITQFVRKDGNLAIVSEVSKVFFEKYPNLSKKWGYMISQEIPYPSFTTKTTNLLGVPNKTHYASAVNEEIFEEGMWYVKEESLLKSNFIFYLIEESFMDKNKLKEIFKGSENVVFLTKGI
jgi:hypothetical protein